MNVDAINSVFREEQPDQMSVVSFDARERKLVLSFAFDGGPLEDYNFVIEFNEAIIFHLPAVLHTPVLFRRVDEWERERLIPAVSYDPVEVSGAPRAYTVVGLDDTNGNPLGYYVAATSVSAAWRPHRNSL